MKEIRLLTRRGSSLLREWITKKIKKKRNIESRLLWIFFTMDSSNFGRKRESGIISYIESSDMCGPHIIFLYRYILFVWFVLELDDEKFSCPVFLEDGFITHRMSHLPKLLHIFPRSFPLLLSVLLTISLHFRHSLPCS